MSKQQYFKTIIVVIFSEIVYREVQCKSIQDGDEHGGSLDFLKIFNAISRTKEINLPSSLENRKFGGESRVELRHLNNIAYDAEKLKEWLREKSDPVPEESNIAVLHDDFAGMVENELLNALSKKTSALLDKPYVQKKGRNDFLVIKPDVHDPFVTIIPNDIYYNVEKKCINWLDDCNQRGLRNRLLQKVNSPY